MHVKEDGIEWAEQGSGQGLVAGSCEHNIELFGSMNGTNLLCG
jgi:hypothetical protein